MVSTSTQTVQRAWWPSRSLSLTMVLLWGQGLYYFITGIWPLLSIETFVAVTGPKTDNLPSGLLADHWLVMTVGTLIAVIGLSLLAAAWKTRMTTETAILAVGSAIGLTAIDVIYVTREVIPSIYLADAAAELFLIALWTVAWLKKA
jgi:hypothetical protein